MADGVKQILARPIQLADQVTKWSDEAQIFWTECMELKSKTERLAGLLRQAARAPELYERPTRRIMDDTEQVLEKALSLVSKCRARGLMTRLFTIIPANAFKKMVFQLDNSMADLSWLLRVSKSSTNGNDDDEDDGYLGLPPIASNDPILGFIWEHIAKLQSGSAEEKVDAAASLVSLARDNDRHGKLIIEEGGVAPLLKLVKEGKVEGQESATRALGLLGKDQESVETMVQAGVCTVFTKILKEAPMKIQAVVASAVSELAEHYPKCQDVFLQNNAVRLLVGHLAFETVQEHSKYAIYQKNSIHSVVVANKQSKTHAAFAASDQSNDDDEQSKMKHPLGAHGHNTRNQMHSVVQSTMVGTKSTAQQRIHGGDGGDVQKHNPYGLSSAGTIYKARESENPETKASMKAMAAKALRHLARGNSDICKSITESKALLCFAVLLEKGTGEVQYNSAMALMEIAIVADENAELRRSAFKPTSPAARAVVDQLLKIVEKGDYSNLLVPSIVALGCLSRTFRASETRIIAPLVRLLDDREPDVMKEVALALAKFACKENFLCHDHSKAIIASGGAKHLVQLAYLGDQGVQIPALVLLCYVALHVPDSEELAHAEVLTVIEWASKQGFIVQDFVQEENVADLLQEAKSRLELYQSRGARNFH